MPSLVTFSRLKIRQTYRQSLPCDKVGKVILPICLRNDTGRTTQNAPLRGLRCVIVAHTISVLHETR
jgi:hypothetical protein